LWRDLVVRLERGGWLAQLKFSATHSLDADAPGQVTLAHVKHEWFCILLIVVKLSSSGWYNVSSNQVLCIELRLWITV
jgi:hypothetical protein